MNTPTLNFSFTAGERQNVRIKHGNCCDFGPMVRKVLRTEWHTDRQGLWFSWYWEPEHHSPDIENTTGLDCGFAGLLILEKDGTPVKIHEHLLK